MMKGQSSTRLEILKRRERYEKRYRMSDTVRRCRKIGTAIEGDVNQGIFEIGSVSCSMHHLDLRAVDFLRIDSRRRD